MSPICCTWMPSDWISAAWSFRALEFISKAQFSTISISMPGRLVAKMRKAECITKWLVQDRRSSVTQETPHNVDPGLPGRAKATLPMPASLPLALHWRPSRNQEKATHKLTPLL